MRNILLLLVVGLVMLAAAPAQAGLLAYWNFEDTLDDAADGFDGLYQQGTSTAGSPTYSTDVPAAVAGHSSKSIDFTANGTDNVRVNLSPSGTLFSGMQNQGTIVAWFKPTALGGVQYVFGNTNNGSGNRLYITPIGTDFRGSLDNPNQSFATGRTINNDTWYHAALVWRADGTTNLYLDGVPDTDNDTYTPFNGGTVNTTTRIGAQGAGQDYFKGLIDDVAVFRGSLSQAQIQALFEGTRDPFNVIPEPGSWTLLLMGMATLGLWRLWRRKR